MQGIIKNKYLFKWKKQDVPAQQLCPPSLPLRDRLVSIVQEAQFAGEEAGVQLAPRQLPAASCTLAWLSESVRRGEESVKGEGEGGVGVTKRERESTGWREGEHCVSTSLPATTHQASQPWRQRQINSWPCVMSEPQQPVTAAEASQHYGAPTEPKSPAKWGSSLATLL